MTEISASKEDYNIDFEKIKELISKYEQIKRSGKIKKYNSKFFKEKIINITE